MVNKYISYDDFNDCKRAVKKCVLAKCLVVIDCIAFAIEKHGANSIIQC